MTRRGISPRPDPRPRPGADRARADRAGLCPHRGGRRRPEYPIARELIAARARVGPSQSELTERMGTSQSTVARLESGRTFPSLAGGAVRGVRRHARRSGQGHQRQALREHVPAHPRFCSRSRGRTCCR
ncbi:helix-turn-helix domain-containing protein [Thiocystis violacea]|uniref:helix-turn-helix domain-containing protein n=1 Tax=Thiocystis violacea TaxID=13725 RepID=UPI0030B8800D